MKNKKFANINHARSYLMDSIIRVNELPVIVQDIVNDGKYVLVYREMASRKNEMDFKYIALDDDAVDMNPLPLGFLENKHFNKSKLFRAYRIPARQWKIGLTSKNSRIFCHTFNYLYEDRDDHFEKIYALDGRQKTNIVYSPSLVDCVRNKYRPVKNAIEHVINTPKSHAAFHRDFALSSATSEAPLPALYYILSKRQVGVVNDNGELQLNKEYMYLTEELTKAVER